MTEVRFNIDDRWLNDLRNKLGDPDKRTTDIMRDALAILSWAAQERIAGRYVVSANNDFSNPQRLVIPSLEAAAAIAASEKKSV